MIYVVGQNFLEYSEEGKVKRNINEFSHYFSKVLFKLVLHVFWIFPVHNNRVTLMNELSFTYGDSMKYLDIYIRKNKPGKYEIVYPIKEGRDCPNNGEIVVEPMTIKYFRHVLSSKVIITNAGGVSYLPLRKKQIIINTWHGGGPYKKTGTAVYNTKWYRKEALMNARNIKYILSSCEYFSKYEAKTMLFKDKQCICSGTPRNDVFFTDNEILRKKVFYYCGMEINQKLVVFAPTYRSNLSDYTGKFEASIIDIDYISVLEALKKRFGGEWRFAVRLHPKLNDIELADTSIINLTEYPDMQELLYAADIVITDYSSLMWDFSLSYKPCLLYAPDIEEYERNRGFYMPVDKWPYPLAYSNDELVNNILNFDNEKYVKDVKKHHIESGSYEEGKACEITLKLIEE
jgi:CDP-glycerol glycerophosphotransferase